MAPTRFVHAEIVLDFDQANHCPRVALSVMVEDRAILMKIDEPFDEPAVAAALRAVAERLDPPKALE